MVTWCLALILSPGEVSAGLRTWLGQGQTLSDAPDSEHNPRIVYEGPDDHWPQARTMTLMDCVLLNDLGHSLYH